MSYEIVPAEQDPPNPFVYLVVLHPCNHRCRYMYGARRFAEGDAERMNAKRCFACENAEELARLSAEGKVPFHDRT